MLTFLCLTQQSRNSKPLHGNPATNVSVLAVPIDAAKKAPSEMPPELTLNAPHMDAQVVLPSITA